MRLPLSKRWVWTAFCAVLLICSLLPGPRRLIFENILFRTMDQSASQIVDAAIVRAAGAYAIARTINAVVSVVEESELMVEPGGVGVSLAIGQVLDPVNDLVERFSWVMLACLTSLGIQKVLIEISPWLSIQVLLSLSLVFLLVGPWVGERFSGRWLGIGKTLLLVAVLVRFCVPVMAWLNEQAYASVLAHRYHQSMSDVEQDIDQLKANDPSAALESDQESAHPDAGWIEKARKALSQGAEQAVKVLDFRSRLNAVKSITGRIFDKLVELIVIFLLNTVLFPLAFLWGIIRLVRLVFRPDFGRNLEERWLERVRHRDAPSSR